jgi:hypothetical protein
MKARRNFRLAGRQFSPGDPFDRTKLAVSARRARQLFEMGKIEEEPTEAAEAAEEPTEAAEAAEEPTEAAEAAEEPTEEFMFDADDLDGIDSLPELREIAEAEGADTKRSKQEQRDAIRENRLGT